MRRLSAPKAVVGMESMSVDLQLEGFSCSETLNGLAINRSATDTKMIMSPGS
jgi:hypothetical protein